MAAASVAKRKTSRAATDRIRLMHSCFVCVSLIKRGAKKKGFERLETDRIR